MQESQLPLRTVESGPEDAPPVVLLHGWGSSAALMAPVARMLSDRRRVVAVDLPGHGTAPVPSRALGMEEHAEAVHALLRRLSPDPVPIVGHSNGGRIALWMAGSERFSDAIGPLALISPSGIRRPRSAGFYVRRAIATMLKAPFRIPPEPIRSACQDWLRHSLVWRALGSSDYRALDGVMRQVFVHLVNTYVEDRLDRIAVPVLLFWGDRDQAVLRPQMDALERGIGDAGLIVLPAAGHYGYLDAPNIVRGGLRAFLEVNA